MRSLLGKGKGLQWLHDQPFKFESLKTILNGKLLNKHFNTKKPVTLMIDASRQFGLGVALCQPDGDSLMSIVMHFDHLSNMT